MEHTIDAKGKKLGRVASEAAEVLMGKNSVDFSKHTLSDVKVKILNSSQIDISSKKLADKRYKSYSGYPGGLKIKSAGEISEKKGNEELLRIAVKGMLPKNKLQAKMLKNLIFSEQNS